MTGDYWQVPRPDYTPPNGDPPPDTPGAGDAAWLGTVSSMRALKDETDAEREALAASTENFKRRAQARGKAAPDGR